MPHLKNVFFSQLTVSLSTVYESVEEYFKGEIKLFRMQRKY